jgi:hypothetical protein
LGDFMNVFQRDNSTIQIMDNSTGPMLGRSLSLGDYDISYSYYSENNEFTHVTNASDVPPFRDNMLTRIELNSK